MEKDEGKIVKVRISDIDKNPFRHFSVYAILQYKVDHLKESINRVGFWTGVTGRWNPDPQKAGRVQIAFGHHRIAAAKDLFKPDDTIPIIIRDLSDDQMREMMIRENAEEYGCVPAAIDDAVSAAQEYLESRKEKAREALTANRLDVKRVRVGAPAIASYTGYSKIAVTLSLQRLAAIESGEVDKEALYRMPHQQAALRFLNAVLESKIKPTVEDQREVAEYLVKEGRFGAASVNQGFKEFLPAAKKNDPNYPEYFQHQLHKARGQIEALIKTLGNIKKRGNRTDAPTFDDVSQLTMHSYHQAIYRLTDEILEVGRLLDEGVAMMGGVERPPNLSPDQWNIRRMEPGLLAFFSDQAVREYEILCFWDIDKRRPVIAFKKREWTEEEREKEARLTAAEKARLEVEKQRLAMEEERIREIEREQLERLRAKHKDERIVNGLKPLAHSLAVQKARMEKGKG
jgi:hypothetical protein